MTLETGTFAMGCSTAVVRVLNFPMTGDMAITSFAAVRWSGTASLNIAFSSADSGGVGSISLTIPPNPLAITRPA